jgi:hypothetical protein
MLILSCRRGMSVCVCVSVGNKKMNETNQTSV